MTKQITLFLLVILSGIYCVESQECHGRGITEEVYYTLTGIWVEEITDADYPTSNFCWGLSKVNPVSSYVIDLCSNPPRFSNMIESQEILYVERTQNVFRLILSGKDTVTIHLGFDGALWYEEKYIGRNQESNPLYRLDGPMLIRDAIYLTPTARLLLRSEPSQNGNILTVLSPGKLIRVKEEGPMDFIDNINDKWYFVEILNGIEGWCFGDYLESTSIAVVAQN